MAMVVKNNMSAVHTLNTLNKNSSALSKNLAKVSSGMKVNGAADDASGYAISERMRVQIRSLDQANANTQNGSSMMKTAEGAVSSTVDILKTLKEKVISAANDDKTDSDRAAIQKELDQSIDQINDNANITYNGKLLVDGSHNQAVKQTTTAMTNQSLQEDTNGQTAFTAMNDRNGNSLNIQNLDTVNISFVKEGKTYTTSMQIHTDDASPKYANNLEGLLKLANDHYAKTEGATDTLKSKLIDDTNLQATDANHTNNYKDALQKAGYEWNSTDKEWAKEGVDGVKESIASTTIDQNGALVATGAGFAFATTTAAGVKDKNAELYVKLANEAFGVAAASNADLKTKVSNIMAEEGYTFDDAASAWQTYKEDGTVDAAKSISSTMVASNGEIQATSAATTFSSAALTDNVKEVLSLAIKDKEIISNPFDSKVGETDYIGRDVAGDTVRTADHKDGLTIKADTSGVDNQISGMTITVTNTNGQQKKSVNAVLDNFSESVRAQNKSADNAITLQVGAKAGQSIRVGLTDMRAQALGLAGKDGKTLQVGTQEQANAAINVLDNAVSKALDQQTTIGSIESRLEYTSSNLTTSSENVQASESTIRDADMAKEMTEYTKNNVLLQAAQSMLAQANQNSSAVLSLLQ